MSLPVFATAVTTQVTTQHRYTLICINSSPTSRCITLLFVFICYPDPSTTLFWINVTPDGVNVDLEHDAIIVPANPTQMEDPFAHIPPSPGSNTAMDPGEVDDGLPVPAPDVNLQTDQ